MNEINNGPLSESELDNATGGTVGWQKKYGCLLTHTKQTSDPDRTVCDGFVRQPHTNIRACRYCMYFEDAR